MSTTRMMILGLVSWLQPVHGYDVRRELLSWDVESWANIQAGSIYHALRKMTEEGLLEEVSTEQVGARPARTTYRITTKGQSEFEELLRKFWWNYHPAIDPFSAAISFLPALPRAEAVAALRNRAKALDVQAERHRVVLRDKSSWLNEKLPHVGWLLELTVDRLEAEMAWCERVAQRIEGGAGAHVHETAVEESIEQWRKTTG